MTTPPSPPPPPPPPAPRAPTLVGAGGRPQFNNAAQTSPGRMSPALASTLANMASNPENFANAGTTNQGLIDAVSRYVTNALNPDRDNSLSDLLTNFYASGTGGPTSLADLRTAVVSDLADEIRRLTLVYDPAHSSATPIGGAVDITVLRFADTGRPVALVDPTDVMSPNWIERGLDLLHGAYIFTGELPQNSPIALEVARYLYSLGGDLTLAGTSAGAWFSTVYALAQPSRVSAVYAFSMPPISGEFVHAGARNVTQLAVQGGAVPQFFFEQMKPDAVPRMTPLGVGARGLTGLLGAQGHFFETSFRLSYDPRNALVFRDHRSGVLLYNWLADQYPNGFNYGYYAEYRDSSRPPQLGKTRHFVVISIGPDGRERFTVPALATRPSSFFGISEDQLFYDVESGLLADSRFVLFDEFVGALNDPTGGYFVGAPAGASPLPIPATEYDRIYQTALGPLGGGFLPSSIQLQTSTGPRDASPMGAGWITVLSADPNKPIIQVRQDVDGVEWARVDSNRDGIFDLAVRRIGDGPYSVRQQYRLPNGNEGATQDDLRNAPDGELTGDDVFLGNGPLAINLGGVGGVFGSTLGKYLFQGRTSQTVGSAFLNALFENAFEGIAFSTDGVNATAGFRDAFRDFGTDLTGAGAGAVSSLLVAELFESLGIEGAGAEFGQSVASSYLTNVISNAIQVARGTRAASNIFEGVGNVNVFALLSNYVGGKLADEIYSPPSFSAQVGGEIGAGIGALQAAQIIALMGPTNPLSYVAAALVVLLRKLEGTFIGSLLGGVYKAGADLGWNASSGTFVVTRSWSKNRGSEATARTAAISVAGTLNSVLDASGSTLLDGNKVNAGAYGQWGRDYVYWPTLGVDVGQIGFRTRDLNVLINYGAHAALKTLVPQMAGGDLFVKRALLSGASLASPVEPVGGFTTQALLADIVTARDYGRYVRDPVFVNALMVGQPNDPQSIAWAATIARAIELGLDKRAYSDWIGGWSVFLDESEGGEIDGAAFAASVVRLNYSETGERLFHFFAADGVLLGTLSDSIAVSARDVVVATGGSDLIQVRQDNWTVSGTRTVRDPANPETGTPEGSHDVPYVVNRTGWRINSSSDLIVNGLSASGAPFEIEVSAQIDGGTGNDTISGGDLGNDLLGSDGDDTLVGGKLDDWLFGGAGNDRLFAGEANFTFDDAVFSGESAAIVAAASVNAGNGDLLDGGEGDDRLYGGRGSDWLKGGAGADVLIGGAGGDIIEGGAGNDRGANGEAFLRGGAGSDQYVFSFDDGQDIAWDESDPANAAIVGGDSLTHRMSQISDGLWERNWAGGGDYEVDGSIRGGEDALVFGIGITFENIKIERSPSVNGVPGNDLILRLVRIDPETDARVLTGDELVLKDWFESTRRVEWFRFADGQEFRIGDVTSFINGTDASEVIFGTAGGDFIYAGAGNDEVHALAGRDFAFGGSGDDMVAGDEDEDLVMGGDGDDKVLGGAGNDSVLGDAGDDDVFGGDGKDLLAGGRGADTVTGGDGNDVIRFARGDGRDVLQDALGGTWQTISVNNNYVTGYARDAEGRVRHGDQIIYDGDSWDGVYNFVEGGTTGNDLLQIWVAPVDGQLTRDSGDDVIEFAVGIDIQDIMLRHDGSDLVIAIGTENGSESFASITDRLTLREYFDNQAIERVAFAATGVHLLTSYRYASAGAVTDGADTILGDATAADWITGNGGDDVIEGRGGMDLLLGNAGADTLKGGAGGDVLFGGANDDVLEGGAGEDRLYGGDGVNDIATYRSSSLAVRASLINPGTNGVVDLTIFQAGPNNGDANGDTYDGIEGLEGSEYWDRLTGDNSRNTIIGRGGADTLIGGGGDDTYDFSRGDGEDIIRDGQLVVDEIVSAAGVLNASRFAVTWELLDLVLPNEFGFFWQYQLTITDIVSGETIYWSRPGKDFCYSGPHPMTPSPAEWPFFEGQGVDSRRTGNGFQVVREVVSDQAGGDDIIEFGEGIALSDLIVTRQGADLRIAYGATDAITIEGQTTAARAVDGIHLADGLYGGLTHLRLTGEAGTASDDLMLGAAGNDTFEGGLGDDIISGAAGDDTLNGGAGNDVLEGGAGGDVLDGGADSNTIGAALVQGAPYGDTIRYVGSSAAVTIDLAAMSASGGDATGDVISNVENVTGSMAFGDTLLGDVRDNRLAGLGGDDTLDGRAGKDVLGGGAGNDTLKGGDGEDNLTGDDGDDRLEGGADKDLLFGGGGADTLIAGLGDDMLSGGDDADVLQGDDGADTLGGGSGSDTLLGGAGNDSLVGEAGADMLQGGAGDDSYGFDAYSGADTITDSVGSSTLSFADVTSAQIWLARSGDDLLVSVIGGDTQVRVTGYFIAGGSQVRQIQTTSQALFLAHAGDLIAAMTAIGVTAPATMPTAIANQLASVWTNSLTPAPRAAPTQTLTTAEDTPLSGAVGATDLDDNITGYALTTGPAHGTVALNATTGAWVYTPTANAHGADSFTITVTDANNGTAQQRVDVTVTPVNDTPANLTAAALALAENAAVDATIGAVTATDVDGAQDTLTYTLVDDANGRFRISSAGVLQLNANAALDHEAMGQFTVRVRVTDMAGAFAEKDFTISVTDVNEAPTLSTPVTAPAVDENSVGGVVVGSFAATDPDVGDTRTFSLVDDAGGRFVISAAGVLSVAAGASLDFEVGAQHTVTVRVTDAGGLSDTRSFTVAVRDVNEAPSVVGPTALTLAENLANGTQVADFTRTDPESSQGFAFTLADNANGRLRFPPQAF
jgi:Ca2+-binding RTX toxin-like protein